MVLIHIGTDVQAETQTFRQNTHREGGEGLVIRSRMCHSLALTFNFWPTGQPTECVLFFVCVHALSVVCMSECPDPKRMKEAAANTPSLSVSVSFYVRAVSNHRHSGLRLLLNSYARWKPASSLMGLIPPSCTSLSKFLTILVPLLIPLDFYLFPPSILFSCPIPSLFRASTSFILYLSTPHSSLCQEEKCCLFLNKSEGGL